MTISDIIVIVLASVCTLEIILGLAWIILSLIMYRIDMRMLHTPGSLTDEFVTIYEARKNSKGENRWKIEKLLKEAKELLNPEK